MYNHAPSDYDCPLCRFLRGEDDPIYSRQADIVYRDEHVTALMSSHHWTNNPGNVIVIPNQHYENIYDLPDALGAGVFAAARRVALAMKRAYGCDGTSTRQHNEPAGNQDVFHFHLHVFPRYSGDNLYRSDKIYTPPEARQPYAEKLRAAFELKDPPSL